MTPSVNTEAYETVEWILKNADMGFFIVTAAAWMQLKIAEYCMNPKVAVYDFSQSTAPYSSYELTAWANKHCDAQAFFLLNMQAVLKEERDKQAFNMSRDVLAGERKIWLFFMSKDLEEQLSVFAYDIYSYVRLKVHFWQEESIDAQERNHKISIENNLNIESIQEAISRYADIEKQLQSLPIDHTPKNQILSAAITLSHIANLYRDCADYQSAMHILETVVDMREKALGKEHPDTAIAYNDIADVFNGQGDYTKALAWYQRALTINEKNFHPMHHAITATCNNIANTYFNRGDYAKAAEWRRRLNDHFENLFIATL